MDVQALAELARGRRVVALTGAGCSTESGIPDYRGVDTPPRPRAPLQHREFVDKEANRRRYWARSLLGWPRLAAATPNAGHRALADIIESIRELAYYRQAVFVPEPGPTSDGARAAAAAAVSSFAPEV